MECCPPGTSEVCSNGFCCQKAGGEDTFCTGDAAFPCCRVGETVCGQCCPSDDTCVRGTICCDTSLEHSTSNPRPRAMVCGNNCCTYSESGCGGDNGDECPGSSGDCNCRPPLWDGSLAGEQTEEICRDSMGNTCDNLICKFQSTGVAWRLIQGCLPPACCDHDPITEPGAWEECCKARIPNWNSGDPCPACNET